MNNTYFSRRVFLEKSLLSGAGLVLAATGCTPGAVSQPDEKSPTPKETENTPTQVPTAQATATATETPQIIPTYKVEDAGGSFTAAQEKLNNSPEAETQKLIIESWLNNYWAKFDKPPFALGSQELKWKYIYNDTNNPTEVMVLIEAWGDYEGKTFSVPVADGKFVAVPPPEPQKGAEIKADFRPLYLSGGVKGLWLSVEKGIPVRRDNDKQVVERLNMESRQWEVVDKYPIDLEKLHNVPQNYEDLVAHPENFVEAPSPFVDAKAFEEWYYEKLHLIRADSNSDINLMTKYIVRGPDAIYIYGNKGERMLSTPDFFFFRNKETFYPTYIFTVGVGTEGWKKTYCVTVLDGRGDHGLGAMNYIANKGYFSVAVIMNRGGGNTKFLPEEENRLISESIFSGGLIHEDNASIGFGTVNFRTKN